MFLNSILITAINILFTLIEFIQFFKKIKEIRKKKKLEKIKPGAQDEESPEIDLKLESMSSVVV